MNERTYSTPLGKIHYWVHLISPDGVTLVFLPGLTADHRLFDKQIVYFQGKYNLPRKAEGLCVHRLRAAATKVYDNAGALAAETNGASLSPLSVEGPLKVWDKGRCPDGIRKEPDVGHDAGV